MDKIFIKELALEVIVGILPKERIQKQIVVLNLELAVNLKTAVKTDDIKDTIDYSAIVARVREFVKNTQFQLLETLAENIVQLILNEFKLRWVRLELLKPAAIPDSKGAGIIMERTS